jgi:predicted dehydrogenase
MTIMAVKAGKNVYVEKPCAHNLHEGEMLTELANKYPRTIIQMGVQGRSGSNNMKGIKDLRDGLIGEVYLAKAWYANKRGSIGTGKKVPVPDWLNWDLWQGPAPHEDYKDNIVHYNWHWFRKWGTGEMGNNAIHQLDNCLWGLGVDYPEQVTSYGGRFHFKDDWEFCDTQITSYKYPGGKQIIWEGRSCNPFRINEAPNGVIYSGTKGTIQILPEDDNYIAYDLDGKVIRKEGEKVSEEQPDLTGISTMGLSEKHFMNTMDAIRGKTQANAPVSLGVKANSLCLLGNISQKLDRTLRINPAGGKIIDDKDAIMMSSRQYEPGWEPKV